MLKANAGSPHTAFPEAALAAIRDPGAREKLAAACNPRSRLARWVNAASY